MILSLDSSTVVDLLRGTNADVRRRFLSTQASGATLKLSVVALYELTTGARKSARPSDKLEELNGFLDDVDVVEFTGEDAMAAGAVRADLEFPGQAVDTADLLIGAQALTREWTVVTSNIRHFGRIRGLSLMDWRWSDTPLSIRDIIAHLTGRAEDK